MMEFRARNWIGSLVCRMLGHQFHDVLDWDNDMVQICPRCTALRLRPTGPLCEMLRTGNEGYCDECWADHSLEDVRRAAG